MTRVDRRTLLLTVCSPCLPALAEPAPALRIALMERNAVSWVAGRLLGAVYQEAGLDLRLLPVPAARLALMSSSGQADGEAIRIHGYNLQHPRLLRLEPALYRASMVAYSRPARQARVQTREDLQRYSLGLIRGVPSSLELAAGHPALTPTLNVEQMFRMLMAGRFDVALETRVGGDHTLRRMGITDLVVSPELSHFDLYHFVHERHAALLPRLSEALKRLRASGELARLTARHEVEVMEIDHR